MESLSRHQFAVLSRLAASEELVFSQDGDRGWFWPSRIDLDTIGISDAELQDLRERKLLGSEQDDENGHGRFGPAQIITEAGRLALAQEAEKP